MKSLSIKNFVRDSDSIDPYNLLRGDSESLYLDSPDITGKKKKRSPPARNRKAQSTANLGRFSLDNLHEVKIEEV